MTKIYFVRHGESEMNTQNLWTGRTDTPLTARGHEQAQKVGLAIKNAALQFDTIVSSPLQRARDTAGHIAQAIDYSESEIIVSNLFTERDFGELEDKRFDIRTTIPYLANESYVDNRASETLADMHTRALEAVAFLHSLNKEAVLVVSHNAFGRMLYRALHNLPPTKPVRRFKNASIEEFL